MIKLVYYKLEQRAYDGISIEVLVPVKTETVEVKNSARSIDRMLELLSVIVERYKNERGYVIEAVISRQRLEISYAITTIRSSYNRIMLYPRPARLARIGLVRSNNVKWVKVEPAEVYVFIGRIEVPKEYDAIILDTSEGMRVLTLGEVEEYKRLSRRRRRGDED